MEIQIAVVTYDELMSQAQEVVQAHYDEAPWEDLSLELDCTMYRVAEKGGAMRFYMATVGGELAGYMSIAAMTMIQHKGILHAVTESFYVLPAYRKSGVFKKLLKYVERDCDDCGIAYLTVAFPKTKKGVLERLIKMAGYKATEVSYSKEL